MRGIDISNHNGFVDFEKVKKQVDFVMIRAGYGRNNIDLSFERNISECNRLGIPCGVYWFSYAYTEDMARREAEYCLKAVKPYKLSFPIAWDFEYDSVSYAEKLGMKITPALARKMLYAFGETIERAGYYCLNYTNKDFIDRFFGEDSLNRFGAWIAQWNVAMKEPDVYQIWQYSNKGKIDGIDGDVDLNKCVVDFPTLLGSEIDVPSADDWGKAEWKWATENGITDGDEPNAPATRIMIATILKRYHDKFGR